MRIELNPLAPMSAAPSMVGMSASDITGRMALEMAAAELATQTGKTGSQLGDAQSQPQSQSQPPVPLPLQLQQRAAAGTLVANPTVALATSANPPAATATTAMLSMLASSPTMDRVTLSPQAASLNPLPAPRADATIAQPLRGMAPPVVALPTAATALPSATAVTYATTSAIAASSIAQLGAKPPAQFLMQVLESLSGEPADQLHWLSLRPGAGGPDAAYGPQSINARADAPLNVLLQGSLRTSDGQQVPFTLAAAIARGHADAALLPQALASVLSRTALVMDYPGVAADLAEQTLHFQMALDPRNLWPLQSFLFSGLMTLGKTKRADAEDESWEWVWEEEEAPNDGLPKKRRQKLKPPKHDPISELSEDGGPPVISGARWLELELRHLRNELRSWMGLPEPLGV